jgi:Co/Zn/Cd efflux system component
VSASCCSTPSSADKSPRYRRVLWAALLVNAAMFAVEVIAGAGARSSALQADALDFLADAANYAISLFVLGAMLQTRAAAALIKGFSMGAFGLWVIGRAVYHVATGTVPEPEVMGAVGVLALVANAGIAALLYRYRAGDSNMRSVWLCTRNDMLGNAALLLAASGVLVTGRGWPDALIALGMAGLALTGASQIILQAASERRGPSPGTPARARSPWSVFDT